MRRQGQQEGEMLGGTSLGSWPVAMNYVTPSTQCDSTSTKQYHTFLLEHKKGNSQKNSTHCNCTHPRRVNTSTMSASTMSASTNQSSLNQARGAGTSWGPNDSKSSDTATPAMSVGSATAAGHGDRKLPLHYLYLLCC